MQNILSILSACEFFILLFYPKIEKPNIYFVPYRQHTRQKGVRAQRFTAKRKNSTEATKNISLTLWQPVLVSPVKIMYEQTKNSYLPIALQILLCGIQAFWKHLKRSSDTFLRMIRLIRPKYGLWRKELSLTSCTLRVGFLILSNLWAMGAHASELRVTWRRQCPHCLCCA